MHTDMKSHDLTHSHALNYCYYGNSQSSKLKDSAAIMSTPSQPAEGFYFDELSKVRVLDQQTSGETEELREECREFVDSE